MKKLSNTRRLYRNERTVYEYYHCLILCLSHQLSTNLKDYVSEENLLKIKEFLLSEVYYQILPFRVWNHLFLCERPQFCVDVCRSCTKLYVSNKRISDHINDNLYVEISHFPIQISEGVVPAKKIYLFAHTNIVSSVSSGEDPFGLNLDGFYYKSVTSPFLLWKAYQDILVRTVFNLSYEGLLPLLVPNSSYGACRHFTACNSKNYRNLILNKIKTIFHKEIAVFCKRIDVISCNLFNPYAVTETFENYQRSVDFLI